MRFLKSSLLLGLIGAVLFVQVASARFYINPVDPDSSWMELPVVPGTEVSAEFVLVNGGEEMAVFEISVVDAEATEEEDGFFALAADTSEQVGVGLWGILEAQEVSLEASESQTLSVTFVIPEDVAFGDYWGGVAAMEKQDPEVVEDESGLKIAIRNGMRVHLEVMSEEDYEALMAVNELEEEVLAESQRAADYNLWLKMGVLTLILAFLIAFLKFKGEKGKTFK